MSLDAELALRQVEAGNQAYRAGDYGGAIARYEAALEAGADGADLWFNLGNALYRAGDHGRAVLAFERTLRRSPGDEGARENLQLIRSQRGEGAPAPAESLLVRIGSSVDPDAAAALLVVGWSLACVAGVVRRGASAAALRIGATVALGGLLLATLAAGAAAWATWQVRHDGWAVVVEPGPVLHAPEPNAPELLVADEGLKVRSDRRIGGYAHVRVGDRAGWIESTRIESIDP